MVDVSTCGLTLDGGGHTRLGQSPDLGTRLFYWAGLWAVPGADIELLLPIVWACFMIQESFYGDQLAVDSSGQYYGLFQLSIGVNGDAQGIGQFCGAVAADGSIIDYAAYQQALLRGDLQLAWHGNTIAKAFAPFWVATGKGASVPADTTTSLFVSNIGRQPSPFEYAVCGAARNSGHGGSTAAIIASKASIAATFFPGATIPGGGHGGELMNAIQKVGGELMRAALTFSYIGPNAQLNVYMGIYDLNSSQYITGEVQSFNTPGSGTYTANLSALVAPDLPVGSYLGAVFQVVAQANNLVISNPNPYQAPDAWIVAG